MIEYLIGVDGGGTGTRIRLASADGAEVAQAAGGPSGLSLGIASAWQTINDAIDRAFAAAALARPANANIAIGLGLAGVHNQQWAAQFTAANPGFGAYKLDNDGFTTLLGAHEGRAGTIVAIGTGSVGQALLPDGTQREVGGWGFPSGDEASGGWLGLRAVNHMQKALDGRAAVTPFSQAIIDACGGQRHAVQIWLGQANQTSYAALAPIVVAHAASSDIARGFLTEAAHEVALIAHALDPSHALPLALCGGLGVPLRPYLPPALLARTVTAHGDAASGALRMIAMSLMADTPRQRS